MTARPLLTLSGVTRSFANGKKTADVLAGIDLCIHAGEMVAIVGPSGAGKSMLMNILGCLDRPTSGTYRVDGADVSALDRDELARLRRDYFGFVFQRYHLIAHLSAAGNVEVPAIYAGVPRAERRERARQLLARLGIESQAARRPAQLSGGEQQRVSIARALMNGGQIILADEPTGALDSRNGDELMLILRELHASGHTVVLITHDMKIARNAQRIVTMADGRIVSDEAVAVPASTSAQPRAEPLTGPRLRPPASEVDRFIEAIRMAWRSLMSHRMRTGLTMLGVVIGIAAVVSISALGEGAKRQMLADIRAVGANTLEVYPGRGPTEDQAQGVRTLLPSDLDVLHTQPFARAVSPLTSRTLRLRHRSVDVGANVNGVAASFFEVRDLRFSEGRPFSSLDERSQQQVVVIDHGTRQKLFSPGGEVVGQSILVGSVPFVVVGVTRESMSANTDPRQLNVWLPYTTASTRMFGQQYFDSLVIRIHDDLPARAVEDSVTRLLTLTHGSKDFFVFNMDSVYRAAERAGRTVTLLLSLVAAISLFVGGVGVMNVMLVSVTERTREVGIRVAVGARQQDVLEQFLTEAVTVCLLSGIIGVALSFCVSLFFKQWPMIYSLQTVLTAFFGAMLVGVVFGFMPARNAARLDPVEALARE
ncbi:MAG: MacB family efflux pump subunit [Rhizobacter sp.]